MSGTSFSTSEWLDNDETRQLSERFDTLFHQVYTNAHLRKGDIIKGSVVDINDYVVLSVGLKSYAYLSKNEFKSMKGELEVYIGQEVDVYLEAVENGYGETRVSREKAKREEAWVELEEAYKENATVSGIVCERVKGGFIVELTSVRAFLPGSQLDIRPVRSPNLEGKSLDVKIIKLNKKRNNIVVSRKAVIEMENSVERDKLLETLEEGQELMGVVKNLTDYGAFVDLGGIDGLLHVTDMSWKRIKRPSEVLTVGDEIAVKVLKFYKENNRVSLGIKQLQEDPWVNVVKRYPVGTQLQGEVTNLTDYGCFVVIEDGVEGLVHMSEMDWTNKNVHPNKIVQIGEVVDVKVLGVDEERRRISLGIKQCKQNPWEHFAEVHKEGDRVKGFIRSITDFGIFIGLEGNIDGLIHVSDMSWSPLTEEVLQRYTKGDEIEVVILGVDADRERISLGVKQLFDNPYDQFMEEHGRGDIMESKIVSIRQRKVTLELVPHVFGVLKSSELARNNITDATQVYEVGQLLSVKLLSLDHKNNIVNVLFEDGKLYEKKGKGVRSDFPKEREPVEEDSLGDLIKEQLASGKKDADRQSDEDA